MNVSMSLQFVSRMKSKVRIPPNTTSTPQYVSFTYPLMLTILQASSSLFNPDFLIKGVEKLQINIHRSEV